MCELTVACSTVLLCTTQRGVRVISMPGIPYRELEEVAGAL